MKNLFAHERDYLILVWVACLIVIAGCSSCAASPVDILIPTKKPTIATQEYLGHLFPTNACNGLYHSLSDTKFEKALVPLRKAELEGLAIVAKGELDFIDAVGSATSNGLWGIVIAGATAIGWQLPSPREGKKVADALHKQPPTTPT